MIAETHFALISEHCDFGEGKKMKKIRIKYILYNSYVPLSEDMVLELQSHPKRRCLS